MKKNEEDCIEIPLPNFDQIDVDGRYMEFGVEIKCNGIWRIHKNDKDDYFPSDFHAHRMDKPEKLDLYTGRVYSISDKNFMYTLPSKVMRFFRGEALARCKEGRIKDIFSEEISFTYLNN